MAEEKNKNEEKKHLYSGTLSNQNKKTIEKNINVQFRHNRKFDLHIGRNVVTFRGRVALPIPEKWLMHPDWKQVEKYFIVKGV
jgi:hypothetical protein